MKYLPTLLLVVLIAACQSNNPEMTQLKAELDKTKAELSALKAAEAPPLVHVVYLDLKDDITTEEKIKLTAAIEQLAEIPGVHNLEYGTFTNLDDPRALSAYEMVFQLHLADRVAYDAYQAHPVHLALKETGKELLAAPPATYDYIKTAY